MRQERTIVTGVILGFGYLRHNSGQIAAPATRAHGGRSPECNKAI